METTTILSFADLAQNNILFYLINEYWVYMLALIIPAVMGMNYYENNTQDNNTQDTDTDDNNTRDDDYTNYSRDELLAMVIANNIA